MTTKPKLIVFDLDYTLWPFWVDTHHTPPFSKKSNGKIVDIQGSVVKCYPDVPEVLKKLHNEGYELAVASRTIEIRGANELIDLFEWRSFFKYNEIFPSSKVVHFEKLQKSSGYKYEDMLFFDDEGRNIIEVGKLGVTCILVDKGVNSKIIEEGFLKYNKKNNSKS